MCAVKIDVDKDVASFKKESGQAKLVLVRVMMFISGTFFVSSGVMELFGAPAARLFVGIVLILVAWKAESGTRES